MAALTKIVGRLRILLAWIRVFAARSAELAHHYFTIKRCEAIPAGTALRTKKPLQTALVQISAH